MRKRKRMLVKKSSKADCEPEEKCELDLQKVLKCTLVQTVLRSNEELELLLRLSSSGGLESEQLFPHALDRFDKENIQAVFRKSDKSCACVNCQEKTVTFQSEIEVGITFHNTDILCSKCSAKDLEKENDIQPENQRRDDPVLPKVPDENRSKDKSIENENAFEENRKSDRDVYNDLDKGCKGVHNDDTKEQDVHVDQKRSQRGPSKQQDTDFVDSVSTDEEQEDSEKKSLKKNVNEPEKKKKCKNQENVTQNSKSSNICNVCGKKFSSRNTLKAHMTTHDHCHTYSSNTNKRNCKGMNNDDTKEQDVHVDHKRSQRVRSKRQDTDFVHSVSTDEEQEDREEKKSLKENVNEPEKRRKCKNQENVTQNSKSSHICNVCGKKLSSRKTLKAHLTTHDHRHIYSCSICKRNFSHLRYVKKHEKTHIKDKPYSCEICGQRFKRKETLPKHMILHGEVKPFQCEICQKRFHLKNQLKKHLLIHSEEKSFVCELCGKRFRTRGSMKSHVDTHRGPEKHSCDQCGKSYRSAWYLKVHLKTHTGENLIQCHSCGDWFIDPCYFKLHQKKFCKGNPLVCSECGQEFPHNQALQSHMGLHTGERPHGCKVCGKGFTKAILLAEHMKRHNPDNSFTCQYCSKGFINKKELERHEKSHGKQKKKASLPDRLKPGHVDPKEARTNDILSRKSIGTGYLSRSAVSDRAQVKSVTGTSTSPVELEVSVFVPCNDTVRRSTADNVDEARYYTHSSDGKKVVEASYYQSTSEPGNCVQIISNPPCDISSAINFPGSADKSSVMESPGPVAHLLQGGHDYIPQMYSQSTSSQSMTLPSYELNINQESGSIIATESGVQLQQLQPITAGLEGEATVAYETETSVQHLLQAAAIIKDYSPPF